jgi:hypothetical protein
MRFDLTEPCADCPFRRKSCPGWTGPWKPADLLEAVGDRPFPCHKTVSHDEQRIEDDTLQSCAGAALFLNNTGKLCQSGWTVHHQERLETAPEEIRKSVFGTREQFLSHHNRRPRSKMPTPHTRG